LKRPLRTDKLLRLNHRITHGGWVLLLALFMLAGCTPTVGDSALPTVTATTAIESPTPLPNPTVKPATETPTLMSPTETPEPPVFSGLCSPLEDITLAELPEILKNPFEMPSPGRDDGHHGADYAYYSRGEHSQMLGLGVMSVLDGETVAVIQDRPPYGNMIIVETPLERLPESWLEMLALPEPGMIATPDGRVNCPALPVTPEWDNSQRSLYVLYAHLNQPALLTVGEAVTCGETIGEVGTTGASVNPHLHIEVRVGPAGASFPVMAHYANNATPDEMGYYCLWRLSGIFQPIDPALLLRDDLK